LESIPESGEIPDPVLQRTAITNNTSNSLCNTERSLDHPETKESNLTWTAQILLGVRGVESNNCL
jgi:hypothetical protein